MIIYSVVLYSVGSGGQGWGFNLEGKGEGDIEETWIAVVGDEPGLGRVVLKAHWVYVSFGPNWSGRNAAAETRDS